MMSIWFLAGDMQSLKWSLSAAVCRMPNSSIWSHGWNWHQNELFGQCFSTVITFRSQSSDLWDILDVWIEFPRIDLNYLPAFSSISVSLCFLLPASFIWVPTPLWSHQERAVIEVREPFTLRSSSQYEKKNGLFWSNFKTILSIRNLLFE